MGSEKKLASQSSADLRFNILALSAAKNTCSLFQGKHNKNKVVVDVLCSLQQWSVVFVLKLQVQPRNVQSLAVFFF